MIRCPRCDAKSRIESEDIDEVRRKIDILRVCTNGHLFETREVHATMVADSRELRSAQQTIDRRTDRWRRDKAIALSKASDTDIAQQYQLTPTRVRQIRASAWEHEDAPVARKIRSSTQKVKSCKSPL